MTTEAASTSDRPVGRARTIRRLAVTTVMGAVALGAGACASSSPSSGISSASTFPGGSPWTGAFVTAPLPSPVNALTGVTCATSRRCWAVGSTVGGSGAPNGAALITTADGGALWTGQPIPPQVAYLSAVACSTTRDCRAVGQAAPSSNGQAASIATSNGGATWVLVPPPAGVLDITTVTCRPDRRCLAIGTTAGGSMALVATSPTSGWTPLGPLPAGISGATSVSCTTDRTCWVTGHTQVDADHVNGVVVVSTDGGATWVAGPTPRGLGYLTGVSCLAGPTSGAGALPTRSTAAGAPSTSTPAITGAPTTASTSPPAPQPPMVGVAGVRCTVVGTSATLLNGARTGHAVLLTSDNGGATWANQTVPATAASLAGVSCTALATCVAVGSTVATAATAGVIVVTGSADHPWRGAPSVSAPLSLAAVSCTSLSSCVAVGESISEHLSGT